MSKKTLSVLPQGFPLSGKAFILMENKGGFVFHVRDTSVGRILKANKQESKCGSDSG
jgi:hypothetical protein